MAALLSFSFLFLQSGFPPGGWIWNIVASRPCILDFGPPSSSGAGSPGLGPPLLLSAGYRCHLDHMRPELRPRGMQGEGGGGCRGVSLLISKSGPPFFFHPPLTAGSAPQIPVISTPMQSWRLLQLLPLLLSPSVTWVNAAAERRAGSASTFCHFWLKLSLDIQSRFDICHSLLCWLPIVFIKYGNQKGK